MTEVQSAAKFMRRDLMTLNPTNTVGEGVAGLLQRQISGAPVVDTNRRYLGMFSEKCCLRAMDRPAKDLHSQGLPIEEVPAFMATRLLILDPSTDVFDAIDQILARKISGAPVVDENKQFLGIFSEKTAMRVLITSAYESVPGGTVGSYMNLDQSRVISESTTLLDASNKFQLTPFRRLPVLRGSALLGQVSRRDVLKAKQTLLGPKGEVQSQGVERHMDTDAKTINPDDDLLKIAQTFETTPYRRLPVLKDGILLGQVSRRDLLRAAAKLLRAKPAVQPQAEMLYLSPLLDSAPPELR